MKKKPICAVEGCERDALMLFAGKWCCGPCIAAYDKTQKELQFNKLQEVFGNDTDNMS